MLELKKTEPSDLRQTPVALWSFQARSSERIYIQSETPLCPRQLLVPTEPRSYHLLRLFSYHTQVCFPVAR